LISGIQNEIHKMGSTQSFYQCCIFRSVPAGTDRKSRTSMQTGTMHPHVPPRPKFRLVSVGLHISARILFWLFILFFFSASSSSASSASASASSAASASASSSFASAFASSDSFASSSALLLLLLCFFFFRPALSLFLYLWWTARRTAVTLQLVMKNQSSFQSTFICMVN
jgi:hypothetical protein